MPGQRRRAPACRRSTPTAGPATSATWPFDLKDADGRGAFLELVRGADVVVESFRPGVVDRLGIGFDALLRRQPPGHPVLDHRLRPGRAPGGVGRPRHQLPGRGGLPGRHRAGGRRRAAGVGRDHRRRRRRGHAGGPGRHGRPHRPGRGRARRPPRRVDRRRGPVAHLAGRRRVPGHRGAGRVRPQHHHRPVRLLRHLPVRRRPLGGGRGHRAQVLRQPVPPARLRAVDRAASSTTPSRTPSGPTSPPPSPPGTATPGSPTLAPRRHLRQPGADRGRAGRRRPVPGPPGHRRRHRRPAAPGPTGRRHPSVRSGPVLAGMPGAGAPVEAGDPARSDADDLLAAAGVPAGRIAELRTKGVVA